MKMQKLQHKTIRLLSTTMAIGLVGVVLGVTVVGTSYAQDAASGGVRVTLEAPAQVGVGEVIPLRLRVEGDVQVGGFEGVILFDRGAGEFAGFAPPTPGELGLGQLIVPEIANGSVVGFYTCGTTPCMNRRDVQVQAAATEAGLLGEVEILPMVAGPMELKLGHVLVVDRTGQTIAVTVDAPSVTVQVGEGGEAHPAPTDGWTWGSGATTAAIAGVTAADVTHDGAVGHSDVMEVAMAWQVVRESGAPCEGREASADLNGDGCVDIVDVQIAAGYATGSSEAVAQAAAVMTFTVNSTLDEYDSNQNDGVCNTASGVCTLRAAIQQANANVGSDTILFAIPGGGVQTIQLESRLPAMWDTTGGTLLDGYSQPEAVPNSDPLVSNAQIRVEIRGQGYGGFDGLPITSAGNVVRGLSFYDLKRSLWIYGSGAYDNVIVGNFIGTNAAGTFAAAAVTSDQAHGVHIEQGALGNHIGGVLPAERNVISGNARNGVGLWHVGTDENVIFNNIVGLSPDGLHRVPNRQQGVDVNYGGSYNTIGGLQPGERNVISGNQENGAEITHGEETTQNVIRGNYIGTDVSGEVASAYTSNGGLGVSLHDRIMDNLVTDNVIGNNRAGGLLIDNLGNCCTRNNKVEHNWIGITPGGVAIGNGVFGVRVVASQSRIGPGNIIAYNALGVQIDGDDNDGNTITENSIFSNTGLGIDISPVAQVNVNDVDDLDAGPNQQLNFPEFTAVSPEQATGTACRECRIEVFIADSHAPQYGEGKTFVGAGMAGTDGSFTVALQNVAFGDFLTATATDIEGNTSEFSLSVLVANPANQGPTAASDSAITEQGIPVAIDVLTNDVDPEGDALAVVAVGAASNGNLSYTDALVIYTSTVDFIGSDSFTYTVADGIGGTSVATVTVEVLENTQVGAGVTIVPAELFVSEGGDPVTFTVVLKSQPTAPVTLKAVPDAMIAVTPLEIVFDASNWNVPQVVSLSIVASELAVTSDTNSVHYIVTSADGNYNNIGVPNIVVNVIAGSGETTGVFLPMINR